MTSTIYYKATRPDGTDFHTGTVDYAAKVGGIVRHGGPKRDTYACCTGDVLHASDVPTETLIGGSWPCRLFEVAGRPVAVDGHKSGFRQLRVVREVDAPLALGPQGVEVAALVERARLLTGDEGRRLDAARAAAWGTARDAAWGTARAAARAAAWGTARDAAWGTARDAAWALTVRDLITPHHYDTLTRLWRTTIGPIHPDDADLLAVTA